MSSCKCKKCKEACVFKPGWFMPGEAERAAAHLNLSLQDFFDKYLGADWWEGGYETDKDVFVLAPATIVMNPGREYPANPRGQCIFYKNGLCSIHEVKPFECKEYICGSDIEDVKNRHKSVAMEWNTEKNQEQIVGLLGCQPISQAYLSSLNDYKYF